MADEITDFIPFDDFQATLKKRLEGSASDEELEKAYQQLEHALAQVFSYVFEQLPFQPHSPALDEGAALLNDTLGALQTELPHTLRCALDNDVEAAKDHLDAAREQIRLMLQDLQQMKDSQPEVPVYSRIPFLQEVARVAVLVRSEELPHECLHTRLEQAWQWFDRFRDGLEGLAPDDRERPIWEDSRPRIERALEGLEQALQELEGADELETPLELLKDASQVLIEIHESLLRAHEQPTERACPRCGMTNSVDSIKCSQCSFIFPHAEAPKVAPTLSVSENGTAAGWPRHVEELLAQAESYKGRRLDAKDMLAGIEAQIRRMENGLHRLGELDAPPEETPPEQMNTLLRLEREFRHATQSALQSLSKMRAHVEKPDPVSFDRATLDFMDGVRDLMQVQQKLAQTAQG